MWAGKAGTWAPPVPSGSSSVITPGTALGTAALTYLPHKTSGARPSCHCLEVKGRDPVLPASLACSDPQTMELSSLPRAQWLAPGCVRHTCCGTRQQLSIPLLAFWRSLALAWFLGQCVDCWGPRSPYGAWRQCSLTVTLRRCVTRPHTEPDPPQNTLNQQHHGSVVSPQASDMGFRDSVGRRGLRPRTGPPAGHAPQATQSSCWG